MNSSIWLLITARLCVRELACVFLKMLKMGLVEFDAHLRKEFRN